MNVEIISSNKNNSCNDEKTKVAAYCRVSTCDVDQIKSYDSMCKYYTDMIKENKDWEIAGIYADKAVTGVSTKPRDSFNRMVEDALSGGIDTILTKSISRFARNLEDGIRTVNQLRTKNVRVVFEEERIDTSDRNSDMLLTVLLCHAQQEVRNTSEHVKLGLNMKMRRGEMVGFAGCLGYNYSKETKTISINEEEAEIVRYIFDRYVQGIGTSTIARELNNQGMLTIRNNPWGQTSVMSVIKNEKYVGDMVQGKTFVTDPIEKQRKTNKGEKELFVVKDHHEPIIDRKTWELAQAILDKRTNKTKNNESGNETLMPRTAKYTFTNMLECGFCGASLTRRSWHGEMGAKYKKIIWHCVTSTKKGVRECPESKGIEEKIIEDAFVHAFNEIYANGQDVIQQFLKRTEKALSQTTVEKQQKKIEKEIEARNNKRSRLIDLVVDGTLSRVAYKEKDSELEEELKALRIEAQKNQNLIENSQSVKDRIKEFKRVLQENELLSEFNSEIFLSLVDKVIVGGVNSSGESDPYKVTFVFKTGDSCEMGNAKGRFGNNRKCSSASNEVDNIVLPDNSTDTWRRSHYCPGDKQKSRGKA